MNLYETLSRDPNQIALITEHGDEVSYLELLNKADTIAQQIKNRCLIFNLCNNSVESVAAYFGFIGANGVQALLSPTISDALLAKLIETYRPTYIFLSPEKAE